MKKHNSQIYFCNEYLGLVLDFATSYICIKYHKNFYPSHKLW